MTGAGASSGLFGRGRRVLRIGPFAMRFELRTLVLLAAALPVLLALGAWATTLGSFPLTLDAVWATLFHSGPPGADFIVWSLRLPRICAALLVGALLAASGAIFQGLVRNALVSPDIVGIHSGAGLAATLCIVLALPSALLPMAAFAGAIAAATLLYGLAWRGGISTGRLILVGIGVNALLGAATTFVVISNPLELAASAFLWSTGSLYASSWEEVRVLAVAALALLPASALLMWHLGILQLGDETAKSLGQRVELVRLALVVLGCASSAIAVAFAGPIGFVAFMIPHVARMVAGPMTGGVLVLTALIGAAYLLAADIAAQHGLPVALPVGAVTAGLGTPYFLFLLWRGHARL